MPNSTWTTWLQRRDEAEAERAREQAASVPQDQSLFGLQAISYQTWHNQPVVTLTQEMLNDAANIIINRPAADWNYQSYYIGNAQTRSQLATWYDESGTFEQYNKAAAFKIKTKSKLPSWM